MRARIAPALRSGRIKPDSPPNMYFIEANFSAVGQSDTDSLAVAMTRHTPLTISINDWLMETVDVAQ